MATLPTEVPEDLEFPSRGESYSTFNTKANLFAQRLAQEVAPTINENAAFVNNQAAAAAQSETNAQASANAASASAALATSAESYAGEWSTLTGSLSIPSSVSHNRSLWVLSTNLADVTLSEPGSLNDDWIEMPSIIKQVAIANNVAVEKVNYLTTGLTLVAEQYLYDATTEATYYSPVALTGSITDIGTDINGVRTVTVGGSPYVIENCTDYGKVTDNTSNGATQVKHRRGTSTEIEASTPAIGELWFNTTDNSIHIGDGATLGGVKHLNALSTNIVFKDDAFGSDIDNMANGRINGNNVIKHALGNIYETKGSKYIVADNGDIALSTLGLFALALPTDFENKSQEKLLLDADGAVKPSNLKGMPARSVIGNELLDTGQANYLGINSILRLLGVELSSEQYILPNPANANTPFIIKFGDGTSNSGSDTQVTFSENFPTSNSFVFCQHAGASAIKTISTNVFNKSQSGFQLNIVENDAGVISRISQNFFWLAIGY